jgi:hypothetical protein
MSDHTIVPLMRRQSRCESCGVARATHLVQWVARATHRVRWVDNSFYVCGGCLPPDPTEMTACPTADA